MAEGGGIGGEGGRRSKKEQGEVRVILLTFLSYEQEAKMLPNFGCAHATCHTAPSCLQT